MTSIARGGSPLICLKITARAPKPGLQHAMCADSQDPAASCHYFAPSMPSDLSCGAQNMLREMTQTLEATP
jgi:hypothetical protein